MSCQGLIRGAAKASPTSHPPAGVRVSTFTDCVLAACVAIPRPLREPMSAWVNGLLGVPADNSGAATLLVGSTGAARTISGAACAQLLGIDNPPSRPADAS